MKSFILVYVLVRHVISLRTADSWANLFRSNIRSTLSTENSLRNAQVSYMENIKVTQLAHPFIVQYAEKCGQKCHDNMRRYVGDKISHYDVINSDHALMHLNYQDMKNMATSHEHHIQDFAPLLPSTKVDSQVGLESSCGTGDVIPLHVVLLPISQTEIQTLVSNAPSDWNSYIIMDPNDNTASPFMSQLSGLKPSDRSDTVLLYTPCAIRESVITYLSSLNCVQWIEVRPIMRFSLEWANGVTQSGDGAVDILKIANLTGVDEIIGIADSGLDMMSCFFHDPSVETPYNRVDHNHRKVIYYKTYADDNDSNGHGTLVCGTAAGRVVSDTSERPSNAAAFRSKLSFFDIGKSNGALVLPANSNTQLYTVLYDTGARVQSMSWGSSSNAYTNDARLIDIFMWEHPDALVLVAAGNTGENGPGTVGTPATNKNGVSVGATLNSAGSWESFGMSAGTDYYSEESLAYFSSRGPTKDGRMKPDVTGVGWYITGAQHKYPVQAGEHCSVSANLGTSFSSPLLAGHAALAREYFVSGYYPSGMRNPADGFEPSGALLKAVLIHGAEKLKQVQLGSGGVESTNIERGDNNQGYGRSQLNNVLSFGVNATLEGLTFFVVGAAGKNVGPYAEMKASDSPHEYTFTTTSTSDPKPIRITLAYTDYYGPAGAARVLINDLDLKLSDGINTYYPIVTNSEGKYDRLNNVEVIILFNPPANTTFTVTVTGHSLSTTQPYALIISGEVGAYPYTKKGSSWLLYIVGSLLILSLGGCFVLTIAACISKKKSKDMNKHSSVAVDPNTQDSAGDLQQ